VAISVFNGGQVLVHDAAAGGFKVVQPSEEKR